MAADLEFDLQDIDDWGWKWPVDFSADKTQFVSFHRSNNASAIDVKMDGSVLEEESSFKELELSFSTKLDWALTSFLFNPRVNSFIKLLMLLYLYCITIVICK